MGFEPRHSHLRSRVALAAAIVALSVLWHLLRPALERQAALASIGHPYRHDLIFSVLAETGDQSYRRYTPVYAVRDPQDHGFVLIRWGQEGPVFRGFSSDFGAFGSVRGAWPQPLWAPASPDDAALVLTSVRFRGAFGLYAVRTSCEVYALLGVGRTHNELLAVLVAAKPAGRMNMGVGCRPMWSDARRGRPPLLLATEQAPGSDLSDPKVRQQVYCAVERRTGGGYIVRPIGGSPAASQPTAVRLRVWIPHPGPIRFDPALDVEKVVEPALDALLRDQRPLTPGPSRP